MAEVAEAVVGFHRARVGFVQEGVYQTVNGEPRILWEEVRSSVALRIGVDDICAKILAFVGRCTLIADTKVSGATILIRGKWRRNTFRPHWPIRGRPVKRKRLN